LKEEHVAPSWSLSYGTWIYNQQPVQSMPITTNKTDLHNIAEILLKVALSTITP